MYTPHFWLSPCHKEHAKKHIEIVRLLQECFIYNSFKEASPTEKELDKLLKTYHRLTTPKFSVDPSCIKNKLVLKTASSFTKANAHNAKLLNLLKGVRREILIRQETNKVELMGLFPKLDKEIFSEHIDLWHNYSRYLGVSLTGIPVKDGAWSFKIAPFSTWEDCLQNLQQVKDFLQIQFPITGSNFLLENPTQVFCKPLIKQNLESSDSTQFLF